MRNGRLALILFVILLISIVGYNAANTQRTADSKTIYKLESGSINAIQITAKDTGVSFVKNGGGWVMNEPAGYKTDKGSVEGLEKLFENLNAVRSIEKNPKDLNKYGLIDPVMAARIKLKDGREKTLLIGGVAASKYQYYVKDSAVNTVYTMSAADVETLGNGDPYAFRDRELLAVNKGKISLLSLDFSGKREMSLRQYDAGKWEFIEPVRTSAKNDALNEIIKGIAGLKIKDFVEDAPDGLYRFGLDKPAISLEIGDQYGKIQRIDFGKRDQEKEEVYIRSDNEKGVFTVSTQDFDPYEIKLGDLLNETPLSVSIDSVKTVRISDKGTVYEFRRDTAKPEEDVFTIGQRKSKKDDFIALYVDLMALSSDGYDPANTGEATEMEILLESREGNDRIKLGLSRRDENSYFMIVNDEPLPFFVYSQKVELVRRWVGRAAND